METVVSKNFNINSWKITAERKKLYSADAVIDAYLRGKSEGLQQHQKVLIQQLEANVKKASAHTSVVVQYIREQGLTALSAYLKLSSFDRMSVLITLSEEDFISDVISDVYNYISSVEETVSEEFYTINFTFAIAGKKFNRGLLESDGYIFQASPSKQNS